MVLCVHQTVGRYQGWSLSSAYTQWQMPGLTWDRWECGGGYHQGGTEPCQWLLDICAFLGSIGWRNILHQDNKSLSLLGLN